MGCNGDCKCGGKPRENPRCTPVPHVTSMMTIIGPVLLIGKIEDRDMYHYEALARDDELWLKLWDKGINNVQLTVGAKPYVSTDRS